MAFPIAEGALLEGFPSVSREAGPYSDFLQLGRQGCAPKKEDRQENAALACKKRDKCRDSKYGKLAPFG